MKQNEQQNRHGNDKETVSMKYSVSDLMYVHCFRNRYRATKRLLATNPEAQLLCTGIMIISDKYENGNYDIRTSMFGSVNNIINTLSDVLIERLKAGAGTEQENREQVLSAFMSYFYCRAKEQLFKEYEDEEESEW